MNGNKQSQFSAHLNSVLMHGMMLLMHVFAILPYQMQCLIGRGLGRLLFSFMRRRRQITAKNLAACFPEMAERAQKMLMWQSFASCGRGVMEASLAWWASERRLRKLLRVEGLEHLQAAVAEGRGVIILTPHLTTLEIAARFLALHETCVVVQRQQKNLVFDRLVQGQRLKYIDNLLLHEDIRGMLNALRAGKVLCILPDQDMGRRKSVFAPFFGVSTATITGVARLAKLSGSPVVPGFCYAEKRSKTRYTLVFSPVLAGYPSGDAEQDAAMMNAVLEAGIRRQPAQYIWSHRLFKTRPENAPSIY